MELTSEQLDILNRMFDFCGEHWGAFAGRCEEAGFEEDDLETIFEELEGEFRP